MYFLLKISYLSYIIHGMKRDINQNSDWCQIGINRLLAVCLTFVVSRNYLIPGSNDGQSDGHGSGDYGGNDDGDCDDVGDGDGYDDVDDERDNDDKQC